MKFHLHALLKMKDLARDNNSDFLTDFIYWGDRPEEELTYEKVIQSFCKRQNIKFFSLRNALEEPKSRGMRIFLEGDYGHFADDGARIVAQLIYDKYLSDKR